MLVLCTRRSGSGVTRVRHFGFLAKPGSQATACFLREFKICASHLPGYRQKELGDTAGGRDPGYLPWQVIPGPYCQALDRLFFFWCHQHRSASPRLFPGLSGYTTQHSPWIFRRVSRRPAMVCPGSSAANLIRPALSRSHHAITRQGPDIAVSDRSLGSKGSDDSNPYSPRSVSMYVACKSTESGLPHQSRIELL